MITNPQCPEGRQHISLSHYAYSIVRNDALTFMGTINYSGFINRIVLNSMLESFDELSLSEKERISNELSKYTKPGRTVLLSEADHQMISRIADSHMNYQIASFKRYPKDKALKIRLNVDLHDILYPADYDWSGIRFNISQGDYVKLLVENYARKTIFDRESIYYKSEIDNLGTILSAAENDRRRFLLIQTNGERFILKPYRLSYDYEGDYHYLIGMAAKYGTTDFKTASFRISRISKITPRGASFGSGKITAGEKKEIEHKIKESGVAYILGEPVEHIVKLTPAGMNMYNSIFHQRPIYEHIESNEDGSKTLTFTATNRQITNYFFTFAGEAEIISPEETKIMMQKRYKSAFKLYNNGG